jgi:uncharacterized protein
MIMKRSFSGPKICRTTLCRAATPWPVTCCSSWGLYTGDGRYHDIAQETVSAVYGAMSQYPTGFAHWLCATAFLLGEPQEVAIIGEPGAADTQGLLAGSVRNNTGPTWSWPSPPPDSPAAEAIPLLANRSQIDGQATAYVCRQFACQRPVTTAAELREQLEK